MRGGGDRGGGPGGFMRGGGDRGGRDRGGRGFGPPPGEGGEASEDRFARFEGMLRGFDTNRDGVIDPNEVPEDRRRFLGFIGARMGVDFSKPVAIDKLREQVSKQFGANNKKEPEPLVPGFGVPQAESTVLAFGERPPEAASSPSSSSRRNAFGGGRGGDGGQEERAQRFAQMMMSRYDRDGNGVAERDKGEWENMRGDPNEIDRNHDGRIDRDELVARIAGFMNRGGDRGGERGGDRGGEQPNESKDSGRKSYRFLAPSERFPNGLPDWFQDKDRNEDGQVTMAEFSSFWSDSEAKKFSRYDLNDDGIVTPDECVAAVSQPGFDASVSESPPPAVPGSEPPAEGGAKPAEEKKETSGGDKPWWMN